ANGRKFAQALTGWIEATSTGLYKFAATAAPSRVASNGEKIIDGIESPGPTMGAVSLLGGGRYHIRWDRFETSPPGSPGDSGLTWQPPGALSQQAIPGKLL